MTLTENHVMNWLNTLKQSWVTKDADLVVTIFAENAQYLATPFREPLVGKEAIHKYWSDGTGVQEGLMLDYEILAIKDNYAIVHFAGSVVQNGKREKWDGIWQVIFNEKGQAEVFKEWWISE